MSVGSGVWRQDLKVWLAPLVVLAVGATALTGYQVALADQAQSGEQGVSSRRGELEELVETRRELEEFADRVDENHRALVGFYNDRLGPEAERLTKTLSEVQDLARRAGLDPSAFSYPDDPLQSYGLVRRSIVFSVNGTYEELRRFVNFLELSDSFVTLEDVGLSERSSGAELRIALRLSVLFLAEGVDPVRLARDPSFAPVSGVSGP